MSESERAAGSDSASGSKTPSKLPDWAVWPLRAVSVLAGLAVAAALSLLMLVAVALAVAYPNLPEISGLTDYRPKLPMRLYSADEVLLGEFGEERRSFAPIAEIPKVMQHAVLAIEDARFYEHSGVDYKGVLRAGLAHLSESRSQGASTITMQVARNFYLSTEKTFTRKIYEVLLALKIESQLSKEQILEVYMNQIFLGQRAYGFAAASEIYFGKPLKDISIAEAAMLAGLPKAPSAYNPIVNPKRATERQRQLEPDGHALRRVEGVVSVVELQAEHAARGADHELHAAVAAETGGVGVGRLEAVRVGRSRHAQTRTAPPEAHQILRGRVRDLWRQGRRCEDQGEEQNAKARPRHVLGGDAITMSGPLGREIDGDCHGVTILKKPLDVRGFTALLGGGGPRTRLDPLAPHRSPCGSTAPTSSCRPSGWRCLRPPRRGASGAPPG